MAGVTLGLLVSLLLASSSGAGPFWEAFAFIACGPVLGWFYGIGAFHAVIHIGWLGLMLMFAHPIYPKPATGMMTIFGLFLWFGSGVLSLGYGIGC